MVVQARFPVRKSTHKVGERVLTDYGCLGKFILPKSFVEKFCKQVVMLIGRVLLQPFNLCKGQWAAKLLFRSDFCQGKFKSLLAICAVQSNP